MGSRPFSMCEKSSMHERSEKDIQYSHRKLWKNTSHFIGLGLYVGIREEIIEIGQVKGMKEIKNAYKIIVE
jgi:hypothetical protein